MPLDTVVWGEGGNTMIFVARKEREFFYFRCEKSCTTQPPPEPGPNGPKKKRENAVRYGSTGGGGGVFGVMQTVSLFLPTEQQRTRVQFSVAREAEQLSSHPS